MESLEIKYEYIQNTRGHVWKTNEQGSVDIFAFVSVQHNGPECILCGYKFCHRCTEGKAEIDCPAVKGQLPLPFGLKEV